MQLYSWQPVISAALQQQPLRNSVLEYPVQVDLQQGSLDCVDHCYPDVDIVPAAYVGAALKENWMTRALVFAASMLALSGCATDPVTGQPIFGNTARGAAIGAIAGGVGGIFAGGNDTRNVAVGAAVGALAGGAIGRYMDQQEADMRKAVANTGIGVQRVGDNIELVMPSDVTFAKDSDMLQSQFTPVLSQVAKSLNLYPKTTIDIIGHASTEGEAQHNLNLSYRRAESVRSYLQGQGVLGQRMATGGLGESQPLISPERSESDRAVNRRVQVVLRPVVQS